MLSGGRMEARTRPGSFEGMGEAALPWIQRAKAETGLPLP
jgi:chorismate mutase